MKMKISPLPVTIRDLVDGYEDRGEAGGLVGYHGKLDIRPPYQREFVYDLKQQEKVIDSVMRGYPLNSLYWVENDDGRYELLDGQQRILSICNYYHNKFSWEDSYKQLKKFHSLRERQDDFLKYQLTIHYCKGADVSEKMEWFARINTAGEKLTEQERLNAVYHGKWVTDAKRRFSKTGHGGQRIGAPYLNVNDKAERQGYLEAALKWYKKPKEKVSDCMDRVHTKDDASEMWEYFRAVIDWIESCFPPSNHRNEMKLVDWGTLYRKYNKIHKPDPEAHENLIHEILASGDVSNPAGVYSYVFSGDSAELKSRRFNQGDIRTAYERQRGKCNNPECNKSCAIKDMEADHKQPWAWGGPSVLDNCQLLCKPCHRKKTNAQATSTSLEKKDRKEKLRQDNQSSKDSS